MTNKVRDIIGEPLRFLVDSDHAQSPYLVDLEANGGVGQCACMDFTTRKVKTMRTGESDLDRCRCKHIKRARGHLADKVIEEYARRQKERQRVAA